LAPRAQLCCMRGAIFWFARGAAATWPPSSSCGWRSRRTSPRSRGSIAKGSRKMIRIFIAALAAFLLVACGGDGFTSTSGAGAGGGGASSAGAAAAEGGTSGAGAGGGGASSAGAAAAEGGTSGAGAGGGGCTSFDASKPALPARCSKIQNNPSGPCNAGDTCITLEQAVTSSGPTEDLCQPTAIKTTCAACRETMTCACLAADFTFDKTGLENWKCCNTAAGPLYVSGYSCPK
jgi:hypothetical protein